MKRLICRIFGILPAEQKNELMALWVEFEERESAEAKYASALDRLQPNIHNFNNKGDTWQKYGIKSRQVLQRNEGIEDGSRRLWEHVQDIVQQSIKHGFNTE
ncbi:HD domain-containing protein [Paenibacillus chungangensis]|uniref:HD domain-containing protein n=1 Tax=Paenibacillus chungangensis TaxID=696535 RepID=A0ABW3HNJ0_9BACL